MDATHMEALTSALIGAPAGAGTALQEMCKQSARKAVGEVLDVLLRDSRRDPMSGIISLRYSEISEAVLQRAVADAIENCCD